MPAAFWQAFAYQQKEGGSNDEKVAIALESIESLSRQIDLIRKTFGIEAPQTVTTALAQLQQQMRSVATAIVQEFIAGGAFSASTVENVTTRTTSAVSSELSKPAANNTEGVDFDKEALLGDLFDSSDVAT